MPRDFSSMITLARDPASDVQIIICADASYSAGSLPHPAGIDSGAIALDPHGRAAADHRRVRA
jgi:hypothetical protein